MRPIIQVENLTKQYLISHAHREPYDTFRGAIVRKIASFKRGFEGIFKPGQAPKISAREKFKALDDISFEISRGESVGIIGKNGAGKSTLLKILSRITEPTSGRITLRGRVASLLEVGTGFHPELTGRENTYLNGSILGMSRNEINRKFDEIVEFSGVEKFLDTPVKYYSSGMRVRLAFSVAAHLEPDILVVDEVLAVGDIEFQTKCLRRMEGVAKGGCTVLFVSHNLSALQRLCPRAIMLKNGQIAADGLTAKVIDDFVGDGFAEAGQQQWLGDTAPSFPDNAIRLRAIRSLNEIGNIATTFNVTESIQIQIEYEVLEPKHELNIHLYFSDGAGQVMFVAMDGHDSPWFGKPTPIGCHSAIFVIPRNFFNEGQVRIEYLICCRPHTGLNISVPDALIFHVVDDRRPGGARGAWSNDWPPSIIRPKFSWLYS
jgi:lipopolysaccharide transport system ATP-binding protein